MSAKINIRVASDQIPNHNHAELETCVWCDLPETECPFRYTYVNKVPQYMRLCQIKAMKD